MEPTCCERYGHDYIVAETPINGLPIVYCTKCGEAKQIKIEE